MAATDSLLPPGPRTPSAWQLLHYSHSPLSFLEGCARRYGDPFTVQWAGYGSFVMLSSPAAVHDVFRAGPDALHSGEGNAFLSATVGTNSVLVLDGEPHRRQRRVLLPPLKGERMRSFFSAIRQATLDEVDAWPVGQTADAVAIAQRITLRVILQVVFGLPVGPRLESMAAQVHRVLELGRGRYGLILLKVLPVDWLQRNRWLPFYRRQHELDQTIFRLIEECRRLPGDQRADTVLSDLLAATHENGEALNDQEIRDALVTIVFAGHDTTAVALAWALEQIVPRPAVVERIEAELQKTTGGHPPEEDALALLAFVDAALRESLRLRTIMPFVVRVVKQPIEVDGRSYPPGVVLCPCSHLVHRREDLYAEPLEFRPDRFMGRRHGPTEWFPFGGGNRACLGMAFALYEMKVVLSTLLATTRLSRPPGSASHPIRRGLALAPHDGAKLTLVEKHRRR